MIHVCQETVMRGIDIGDWEGPASCVVHGMGVMQRRVQLSSLKDEFEKAHFHLQ